ncbi:MAG: DNA repair protein RadC [Anaerolineaceae bacterium]|nr:DNA repair protein RadC [Anaerolineaceae bacterium]
MGTERYHISMRDMPVDSRPRERLAQLGERALSTAELLAITIRTGDGDGNNLHLAEKILTTFNGLPGIARASITELTTLKGIGRVKAIEIKAALELGRRLAVTSPEERPIIASPADAANLVMAEMRFYEQEHFRAMLLDTRNSVLSIPTIHIGTINSINVRPADTFRAALKENARSLILIHNHPSENASPSPEDVSTTRKFIQAGKLLDIEVLDHIVVGGNQFVSLKERGLAFD